MSESIVKKPHTLALSERSKLSLTGVEDVKGFDENTVDLRLADSSLVVKGNGLHISRLSLESGDVVIDGEISSLQYLGSSPKSIRSRLFK